MRHKPSEPYSGLTVVIDTPSRFDRRILMSGYAGAFFDSTLTVSRYSCDLRTLATMNAGLLPDTKVVLLLGRKSLHQYKPGVGLDEQRGNPWIEDGVTYIASYMPQDTFDRKNYFNPNEEYIGGSDDDKVTHGKTKRQNWRFWLRKDLKKACRYLLVKPTLHEAEEVIYPEVDDVVKDLTETKGKDLFFDVETASDLTLTCFGYGWNSRVAVCVPMYEIPRQAYYYGGKGTARILRALAVAFRDNTVVIHNALFDLFVMAYKYGIPAPRKVYDTMLAHHRLYPEVEKSLGHCISLYTDREYHKNEGVFEPRNQQQILSLYHYNAKDVVTLALLKPKLDLHAKQLYAEDSIRQVNESVTPYLTAMFQGLNYDKDKLEARIAYNNRYCAQISRMLSILVGYELNPNSPKQVSNYLYNCMRYKKPAKDLTNEKTILQLRLKHNNPVLTLVLKYREIAKQSGQLKFPPYVPRGTTKERVTTAYNLAGTTTYRLASRRLLNRWGTNVQNFPKDLRKLFIPDEGKVFIQVDQSGAEALVVSYLCTEGNFRSLFLHGIKSHVYVALRLFADVWSSEMGHSVDEFCTAPIDKVATLKGWADLDKVIKSSDGWSAEKRYYFISKMVCHASNYGMKPPTFRLNLLQKSEGKVSISLPEAKRFLNTYHELFPEIQLWHRETVNTLRRDGILRNLFGYPRVFTAQVEESMYKEAYAFVPQSTVGTITNLTFSKMQQKIEDPNDKLSSMNVDIVQNNHDSVLIQCPPEHADYVAKETVDVMNCDLVSPRGERFKMKSEACIGDTWGGLA